MLKFCQIFSEIDAKIINTTRSSEICFRGFRRKNSHIGVDCFKQVLILSYLQVPQKEHAVPMVGINKIMRT